MHFKNVGYAQCLKNFLKSQYKHFNLKVADQYGETQFQAAFL